MNLNLKQYFRKNVWLWIALGIVLVMLLALETCGKKEVDSRADTDNAVAKGVVTICINGSLDTAEYKPAAVKVAKGQVVKITPGSGLVLEGFDISLKKDKIKKISKAHYLKDVFFFRVPGNKEWGKLKQNKAFTTVKIEEDGIIEFSVRISSIPGNFFVTSDSPRPRQLRARPIGAHLDVLDNYAGPFEDPEWFDERDKDVRVIGKALGGGEPNESKASSTDKQEDQSVDRAIEKSRTEIHRLWNKMFHEERQINVEDTGEKQ